MKSLNVLSAGKLLKFMLFLLPVARFPCHAFVSDLYSSLFPPSPPPPRFLYVLCNEVYWRCVMTTKQTNRGDETGDVSSVETANGILKLSYN